MGRRSVNRKKTQFRAQFFFFNLIQIFWKVYSSRHFFLSYLSFFRWRTITNERYGIQIATSAASWPCHEMTLRYCAKKRSINDVRIDPVSLRTRNNKCAVFIRSLCSEVFAWTILCVFIFITVNNTDQLAFVYKRILHRKKSIFLESPKLSRIHRCIVRVFWRHARHVFENQQDIES